MHRQNIFLLVKFMWNTQMFCVLTQAFLCKLISYTVGSFSVEKVTFRQECVRYGTMNFKTSNF